jgi:hypothetical protein
MLLTSAQIVPLAQRLHTMIPECLQRWTAEPDDSDERGRLADAMSFLPEAAMPTRNADRTNPAMQP